jgi:crotonobetaine/carnitine-CoA ligase
MSLGYWNQSAASVRSSSNLWHHTGDLGRMDKAGRVWVVDRKVDALRRRGENVSSTELEAAIRRHPAVDEVAVLGVASAMSEQEIKACIRLAPGQRLEPRELFAFFQAELPYFAIPRYVELVETFPVNAAGRIRKDVLREDPLTPATWDLEAMGLRVAPAQRR